MIIWEEEDDLLAFKRLAQNSKTQGSQLTPRNIGLPIDLAFAAAAIGDDIKSDVYHKTVGYGLIAVGVGVLVATRGAGWKPASIIMSTGLNNLAEVSA